MLRNSSSWRKSVSSMRVSFSNLSITAVNEQFGMLVSGNLTSSSNCIGLPIKCWSQSWIAFAFNTPLISSRNDMLVFSHLLHLLSAPSFDEQTRHSALYFPCKHQARVKFSTKLCHKLTKWQCVIWILSHLYIFNANICLYFEIFCYLCNEISQNIRRHYVIVSQIWKHLLV